MKVVRFKAQLSKEEQAQLWILVKADMSPAEISETMEKPVSVINEWCDKLGLKPRKMTREEINARYRARKEERLPKIQPAERVPLKRNPMREAETYLGQRLQERNGQYFLDGAPSNLDRIIRATNVILKASSLPQLDANKAWVV